MEAWYGSSTVFLPVGWDLWGEPTVDLLCVCLGFLLCKIHVSHLLHKVVMRMNHPDFFFLKKYFESYPCAGEFWELN